MSSLVSVLPRCVAMCCTVTNDKTSFLYLEGGHPKRASEDHLTFGEITTGDEEVITSRTHTRFHLDPSKEHDDEDLFHVRAAYNNKYLVARQLMEKDPGKYKATNLYDGSGYLQLPSFLFDLADKPQEDLSKPWCTLFRIRVLGQYGIGPLERLGSFPEASFSRPQSNEEVGFLGEQGRVHANVFLLDVSEQTILPPYVVFKIVEGKDDMYLKVWNDYYLQFAYTDMGDRSVWLKTYNYADGTVRLKSVLYDKFLKFTINDHDWIRALGDSFSEDGTALFKAWKDGNFFSLQTVRSNRGGTFCICSKDDRLAVGDSSITGKAKFMLEEPVLSREIYNVQYHEHRHHARVYDTKNMSISTATANNRTSEKNIIKSSASITTKESSKWEATATHKANVQLTFHAGFSLKLLDFLDIDGGWNIQYGYEFSHATTWGTASEVEKKQEIDYEVTVPANKKVTLTVTATQAKYDVAFSYTQKDRLLSGEVVTEDYDDGLYTGMNCFDLRYETNEEEVETSSSKKRKECGQSVVGSVGTLSH